MDAKALIRIRRMVRTGAARAIREEAGLSLAEVAAETGVHRSTIQRWETGQRKPRGKPGLCYLRFLESLVTRQ